MLHVLVQFARTEYEYKPRKAKPSPPLTPPTRSKPIEGGSNSAQATPSMLGLNILLSGKINDILYFSVSLIPFENQCCSVVLGLLEPPGISLRVSVSKP